MYCVFGILQHMSHLFINPLATLRDRGSFHPPCVYFHFCHFRKVTFRLDFSNFVWNSPGNLPFMTTLFVPWCLNTFISEKNKQQRGYVDIYAACWFANVYDACWKNINLLWFTGVIKSYKRVCKCAFYLEIRSKFLLRCNAEFNNIRAIRSTAT